MLSYMISPFRGSEYSVGWNYVTHMSVDHELVVLYGAAGEHLGDVEELENYLAEHPMPNVRFIAVRPSGLANWLNGLNRRGMLTYSFYLAYALWHRQVYRVALELTRREEFDLIHYLNPIGYREPGYLWKIDLPYLWGPVGGAPNYPKALWPALPAAAKWKFGLLRSLINSWQLRHNRRVANALKHTDLLLTATTENQNKFRSIHGKESVYMPENCIVTDDAASPVFPLSSGSAGPGLSAAGTSSLHGVAPSAPGVAMIPLRFVWIGRIDAGKALIILLEALAAMPDRSGFVVDIIGDGPLRLSLQDYAQSKGITNLVWHGRVDRTRVDELLSVASLHLITSMSEGNPTTIWEAMSKGVPTLSLDHCGMHDVLCDDCGIRIPVESYAQVVETLAGTLQEVVAEPGRLATLSTGTHACARRYSWAKRREQLTELYTQTIEAWKSR